MLRNRYKAASKALFISPLSLSFIPPPLSLIIGLNPLTLALLIIASKNIAGIPKERSWASGILQDIKSKLYIRSVARTNLNPFNEQKPFPLKIPYESTKSGVSLCLFHTLSPKIAQLLHLSSECDPCGVEDEDGSFGRQEGLYALLQLLKDEPELFQGKLSF